MPYSGWLVIDSSGTARERIMWDGLGSWRPPEGCTAIPDDGRPDEAIVPWPAEPEPEEP